MFRAFAVFILALLCAGQAFAQQGGRVEIFIDPPLSGRLENVSFDANEDRVLLSDSMGNFQVRRTSDWFVTARPGRDIPGSEPPWRIGNVAAMSPAGDRVVIVDSGVADALAWIEPTESGAFKASTPINLRPAGLDDSFKLAAPEITPDFKWVLVTFIDFPAIPREGQPRAKLPDVKIAYQITARNVAPGGKGQFTTQNAAGETVTIVDGAWTAGTARQAEIVALIERLGQKEKWALASCSFPSSSTIRTLLITLDGRLAIDGVAGLRIVNLAARFGVSPEKFASYPILSLQCSRAGAASWLLYRRPADYDKRELWANDKLYVVRIDAVTGELADIASHTGFSYQQDAIGSKDSLILSYDTRAFFYDSSGKVREFSPSGGTIYAMTFDQKTQRLGIAPQTEYLTHGEYTPWWTKGRMRVVDFIAGQQTWSGPETDCRPEGGVLLLCEHEPGSMDKWFRGIRQIASDKDIPLLSMLGGRKIQDKPVYGSTPMFASRDGRRMIVRVLDSQPADPALPAAARKTTLMWLDLDTGASRPLTYGSEYSELGSELEPAYGFIFSSDLSKHLKVAQSSFIKDHDKTYIGFIDTASTSELASWSYRTADQFARFYSFNPNGTRIAYAVGTDQGDNQLVVIAPDGAARQQIPIGGTLYSTDVAWSQDGKYIYSSEPAGAGSAKVIRRSADNIASAKEWRLPIDGSVSGIEPLNAGRIAVSTDMGAVHVFDEATGREQFRYYALGDGEWIALTPEGYFNSSSSAVEGLMRVRINGKVSGLGNFRERFYRPDIVQMAMTGQALPASLASVSLVKPAPQVAVEPASKRVTTGMVPLAVTLTESGGGIGGMRVLLNDSAVLERDGSGVKAGRQTIEVKLVPGANRIRVAAFNADRSMTSDPADLVVEYVPERREGSTLHVLSIGIQDFSNPVLKLAYPVADAKAMAETLTAGGAGVFDNVEVTTLVTPEETTKEALLAAFKRFESISPNDAFVLYVATHGSVEGGDLSDREFMLYTSNVGLLSTEALRRDAIGQADLTSFIANVPATRKLILLDTCNSGAVGDSIIRRGVEEAGAVKVLSHATGTTILAASTAQQQAVEGYKGHGLFTWVLMEALKGGAAIPGSQYVSNWNVTSYVGRQVPELAQQVFQHKQFPTLNNAGAQFELAKVK